MSSLRRKGSGFGATDKVGKLESIERRSFGLFIGFVPKKQNIGSFILSQINSS